MWQKLTDFAHQINLPLSPEQAKTLVRYGELVWQKKDFLNLTSAADLDEILARHICDGLQGAACVQAVAAQKELARFSLLDAGSGAGYIGLTMAVALPQVHVTLVESLEKRCAFMNWVILQLGLKNAQVKKMRLGEQKELQADFVTERAMGQLNDILDICLGAVKPGGVFIAYQGENSSATQLPAEKYRAVLLRCEPYTLSADLKTRQLVLFGKDNDAR